MITFRSLLIILALNIANISTQLHSMNLPPESTQEEQTFCYTCNKPYQANNLDSCDHTLCVECSERVVLAEDWYTLLKHWTHGIEWCCSRCKEHLAIGIPQKSNARSGPF